ncbi:MAG TPA: TonB-dependent receptor [Thermoanaerobaculia bacterium]|nr:TonB-dependent receptor [Thermoanaerobaculia bacterium]
MAVLTAPAAMLPAVVVVAAAAAVLLLPAAADAAPAGRLIGTVRGPDGGVLPGATVTVSSPALIGGPRAAASGTDGTFAFPGLDPGVYSVEVELAGFRTARLAGVRVSLDHATAVFPRLETGELREQITVSAERPVIDPTQVAAGQVFTAEFVDRSSIGADDRNYQSVVGSAAGAITTEITADPSIFGSTIGENVYLIDGLDTTDPYTATYGTNFNFDAIQEVSLLTAGFEAEYGRATGGVVNVVTKSGGNDFHGTFDTRYRNDAFAAKGQHFDPEAAGHSSFLLPAATFGGPLLHDRLWFFTSAALEDQKLTPTDSPTVNHLRSEDYLGKLSWQLDERWRAVIKASSSPATLAGFNASQFVEPQAAATERQRATIFQADLSALLSSRMVWELQLGDNERRIADGPASGDLATPGVIDQATQISSGNYTAITSSDRRRQEAQTSLTLLAGGPGGDHELKGGASYGHLSLATLANVPGGGTYTDNDGPSLWSATPWLPSATFTGGIAGGYLQDAWQPLQALTVKAGLRYDEVTYHNDAGSRIADLHSLQPRLGVAWDPSGDARTVLRGSYRLFMHPGALSVPLYSRLSYAPTTRYLSCTNVVAAGLTDPAAIAARCQAFAAANGGTVIADPLHRDPNGYGFLDVLNTAPNVVDPNLQPTVARELTAGVQQRLGERSALDLTWVYKRTRNILEDTCVENLLGLTPDPGLLNCPYKVLTNPAAARRDYHGLVLRLDSRAGDWLYLVASYTYAVSKGSVEYTQGAGSEFDVFPVHFVNTYGFLSDDVRHRVKLKGFVKLPGRVSVGFNAIYQSPFDYSVLEALAPPLYGNEFLEPRGSRRANGTLYTELEVRKAFQLGRVELELIGSVENVLGNQPAVAVCQYASGCTSTGGDQLALGAPTDYQQPRNYEVGVRLLF